MSILGALKQMKQQTGSLDELASLPHVMIMQMARTGQIPKEQVLPILSRKKELADDSANTQAAQRPTSQPTLLEKILAAEQPQQMADMGVAQLPIREDMYDEKRMAGGGIVAFRNNEDQPISEDMPITDETNPYLSFDQRLQGMQMRGNPFMARQPSLFSRGVEAVRQLPSKMSALGPKPMTSEEVRRRMPTEPIQGDEQELFNKEAAAKKPKNAPTVDAVGNIVPNPNASKTKEAAAAAANVVGDATGAPKPSVYEEMLLKQGEDATKARQEAKYMRLLEAGLGIMGGTSPYAFTNIGQGAIGAAKGYAEDIKGFRAEERDRAKALGALGMEKEKIAADREKTAMLERRYAELAKLEKEKIGAMYGGRADEKFVNQVNQVYRADISALKNQLGRELTDEELNNIYTNAYNRVASVTGKSSTSTSTQNKDIGFGPFMQLGKK